MAFMTGENVLIHLKPTKPMDFKLNQILKMDLYKRGPLNWANQLLVERVQRRATRLIPMLGHLTYEERLEALKLVTFLPETPWGHDPGLPYFRCPSIGISRVALL